MIKMIWCEDTKHGVGIQNLLPWSVKEEMEHFRNETRNKTVVMGEATFHSIGQPLKNRTNIVLTNNPHFVYPGIKIYYDLNQIRKDFKNEDIYIIGGCSMYKQFFPYAQELIISTLKKEYNCDRFLEFDLKDFKKIKTISNDIFDVNYYQRKKKRWWKF